jgi:hypothetical protein
LPPRQGDASFYSRQNDASSHELNQNTPYFGLGVIKEAVRGNPALKIAAGQHAPTPFWVGGQSLGRQDHVPTLGKWMRSFTTFGKAMVFTLARKRPKAAVKSLVPATRW